MISHFYGINFFISFAGLETNIVRLDITIQREEADRKFKEEMERREIERLEKTKREDEERLERKKVSMCYD